MDHGHEPLGPPTASVVQSYIDLRTIVWYNPLLLHPWLDFNFLAMLMNKNIDDDVYCCLSLAEAKLDCLL